PVQLEPGRRRAHRDVALDDPTSVRGEHLAQLRLGPDGPEGTGAGPHDRDWLVPQRMRGYRPGDPIHCVLQLAGNRGVVLRSRDENRVSICDRLAQRGDCRRRRLDVVLLVVGWHGLEALVELELHVGGQKLLRRAEELRVVRIPAQTARDREDLHPAYASLTK